MKAWICLPLLALVLTGCAGKTAYRDSCATNLDAAWHELDLAKAEGFAGTVSNSSKRSRVVPRRPRKPVSTFASHARADEFVPRAPACSRVLRCVFASGSPQERACWQMR
jgi:hypothetical protein